PGQTAVAQTVFVPDSGTYTLTFTGANSTTGNYTVQVYLNAAVENPLPGVGNKTRASAQSLDTSFVPLGTNQGAFSRAAVIGSGGASAVFNASDSGTWSNTGSHSSGSGNYLAGQATPNQYHDYFAFYLGGLSQPVASARLSVANPS